MQSFNEVIVCYGNIFSNVLNFENLRCTLTLNKIDTRLNKAEITSSIENLGRIDSIIDGKTELIFESNRFGRKIYLKSKNNSFQAKFSEEVIVTLRPYIVNIEDNYTNNKPGTISINSNITPSRTIFNKHTITQHATKGLLSNWNFNREVPNENEWLDENISYETDLGKIDILSGFIFNENKENVYPKTFNVIRQLFVSLKTNVTDGNQNEIITKYFVEIEILLKVFSLLFSKRFEVFYTNIYYQDKEQSVIAEHKIYNKIKFEQYIEDNRFIYGDIHKNIFNSLSILIQKYRLLDIDKKELFNKLLDRYLIAFTNNKMDTTIIYALSCLDIIKNSFEKTKGYGIFIKDLIDVCETNQIKWLDLFPYLLKEEVFNKKNKLNMKLYKIRNKIIHSGIYPDSYKEIYDEILCARALCERFMLKLLSIDYENTGLGIKTRY